MSKKSKAIKSSGKPSMIYAKLIVKPPVMQGGQVQIFCEFSGNEDETKIMRDMFSTYHGTPFCFFAEQNFIPISDSLFCRYPVPPWEWAMVGQPIQHINLGMKPRGFRPEETTGKDAEFQSDHGA